MSRQKRFELSFKSDNGPYYKIEIFDNDAISSVLHTPSIGADGFNLTYQTQDENRFVGLIPSEVKFDIFIDKIGEQSIVNDIKGSVYGQFDMAIYQSSDDSTYSLFWAGILLNDISPEEDLGTPIKVSLTAVDGLAPLKDIDFNKNTGFSTPSSFQTLYYFISIFRNQIGLQDFYWSITDTFITTSVLWSTSAMTYVQGRDPLVLSRFNFMAYVEVNDDGSKKFSNSFDFLDNVCKCWGMRCFFSDGRWHLVQVNNYDNWKSPNTHFIRNFSRVLNSQIGDSLLSSSSASYTVTEGTNIKRYDGEFDFLPILRSVETNYNFLTPYDMPFFYYQNSSGGTQYQTDSNEIPIWNGYRYNNQVFTGSDYSINNGSGDSLVISLGNVTAVTGSSILFNRNLSLSKTTPLTFDTTVGANTKVTAHIKIRFKLVGASNTYYHPLSTALDTDWVTTSVPTTTVVIGPYFLTANATQTAYTENVNLQTQELPEDGELFLEAYAICYYNTLVDSYATVQIAIDESTTETQPEKILVYSQPENNAEQGIKYLINNDVLIKKKFEAFNSPGGTTISNGVKLEIPELFIGTGPTSGAVGRIEVFDVAAGSWNEGIEDTWRAFGESVTGTEITQLLVEQVLKGQSGGARIFNGSLKITSGQLHYYEGIEIDNTTFIPYQCTYNAREHKWSGQYYGVDLSGNALSIITGVVGQVPVAVEFEPISL